jgi:EAL domain-containing protein (putative c-di-GMP-specific phosphodiesterase class I)
VLWQPIVDADGGRVVQADTQICLYTNNGELISQRDLLRVSERSGSAHRLGFLALKTICSAYASLDMARRGVERVQVRLSAFQCLRSDLPQQILAVTEALGLEPSRLCLEITEAAATHSPEAATRNMRLLSAQGVTPRPGRLRLGLHRPWMHPGLPFDLIKLDKAVIRAGSASERGSPMCLGRYGRLLRRLNRRHRGRGRGNRGTGAGPDRGRGSTTSRVSATARRRTAERLRDQAQPLIPQRSGSLDGGRTAVR